MNKLIIGVLMLPIILNAGFKLVIDLGGGFSDSSRVGQVNNSNSENKGTNSKYSDHDINTEISLTYFKNVEIDKKFNINYGPKINVGTDLIISKNSNKMNNTSKCVKLLD